MIAGISLENLSQILATSPLKFGQCQDKFIGKLIALSNLVQNRAVSDPFEMPGGDYTLFDSITFSTDRESYCIGQIALYRRLLGYDAMKYD